MVMLEDLKRWPHDKDLFSCSLEERPLTATFSPCGANNLATANPIPAVEPVISTFSLKMILDH